MKDFKEKLKELKSVMGKEDAESQARFATLSAELKAVSLTDEVGKEIDRIERKANLREQLDGIIELLPMSYIAKHYFGKSASWLYQRINGNAVRGRVYTLNDEQKATFDAALQDIARQLSSFSISK